MKPGFCDLNREQSRSPFAADIQFQNGKITMVENHPFLTAAAAESLKNEDAKLVGIDSFNIDDTQDGHRPVHTVLLRAGIPIVEHLCGLEQLPENGARFTARAAQSERHGHVSGAGMRNAAITDHDPVLDPY